MDDSLLNQTEKIEDSNLCLSNLWTMLEHAWQCHSQVVTVHNNIFPIVSILYYIRIDWGFGMSNMVSSTLAALQLKMHI